LPITVIESWYVLFRGKINVGKLTHIHEQIRDDNVLHYDYLLHCNLLSQQYFIDVFIKAQDNNLEFLRRNQEILRSAPFSVYEKAKANNSLADVGREVPRGTRLPESFGGSDRNLRERFRDTLALCRLFGNPALFITMTANPNWPEIVEECKKWAEDSPMRADVTSRVFTMKLKELEQEIYKLGVFGNCVAHTRVTEFQKRGLPHAHIGKYLYKYLYLSDQNSWTHILLTYFLPFQQSGSVEVRSLLRKSRSLSVPKFPILIWNRACIKS